MDDKIKAEKISTWSLTKEDFETNGEILHLERHCDHELPDPEQTTLVGVQIGPCNIEPTVEQYIKDWAMLPHTKYVYFANPPSEDILMHSFPFGDKITITSPHPLDCQSELIHHILDNHCLGNTIIEIKYKWRTAYDISEQEFNDRMHALIQKYRNEKFVDLRYVYNNKFQNNGIIDRIIN